MPTALPDFTPSDVLSAGYSLGIFCNPCRVLRDMSAADLVKAGRGDVRLVDLVFRCQKCRAVGSPHLTWRDEGNGWRSFDYARMGKVDRRQP